MRIKRFSWNLNFLKYIYMSKQRWIMDFNRHTNKYLCQHIMLINYLMKKALETSHFILHAFGQVKYKNAINTSWLNHIKKTDLYKCNIHFASRCNKINNCKILSRNITRLSLLKILKTFIQFLPWRKIFVWTWTK